MINKTFIFILLLSLWSCNEPKTVTKVTQAFINGATKTETVFAIDEITKLKQTTYYEDGKVNYTGEFKNNERHGKWEAYYDDGSLWTINNYTEGEHAGNYILYHRNGEIRLKGQYKNGEESGIWLVYNEEGKQVDKKTYDN